MAILKCKMCGGELNIRDGKTVAECEYCGTTQTLPKLVSDDIANLYDRANHFRRNNEFDKAEGIYERILSQTPEDAEAYWSLVLCRYGIEYVEDPATRKRVPTVNRTQYTSIFDDENYKSAIEHADAVQRRVYEEEAAAINEIQKGILAISQKEEPFDVFICYKESDNNGRRTPDSVLATDLYHQLTNEGFKVFFARITLEDKLGTAYEPYIFAALNSAKVMVVLGTKPEYFNAVWVKNEWSRYLALVKQSGGKKVLIPAYRDMDPYDLPEEFSHLQAQDMSKLGFMQDLIRGIKKITGSDQPKPVQPQAAAVNPVSAGSADIAPLLKRMFMYLEDGEWDKANEYSERVLDKDPENAEAYLGKLMVDLKVRQRKELKNQAQPFDGNKNYNKAIRFAVADIKNELTGYIDFINNRNAEEKRREEAKRAAEIEEKYTKACSLQNSVEEDQLATAIDIFKKLKDYKDSSERLTVCERAYKEKKAEREKREEHEKAERIERLAPIRKRLAPYRNLIVGDTVGLKEDGTVVAVGSNDYGQCNVTGWKDIVSIAVGRCRTIGLKADGTVESAGSFEDNGYRSSDNRYRKDKTELSSWRNIKAIVTTDHRVIGLKTDGTVVTVGHHLYGGDTSYWSDIIAVAATYNHTVGLKSDGTVVAVGDNKHGQCDVEKWTDIVAIAAGNYHTVGLKSNGTVVATEFRNYGYTKHSGQCDVSDWTDIVEIAAGFDFTVGLRNDGTVAVACDSHSMNNDVKKWKEIVSIYSDPRRIVGIKSDGTVVSTRNNLHGKCDFSNWHDIVAVAVSDSHTAGLKADGTVVATGASGNSVSDWKLFKPDTEKYTEACRLQDSGIENNLEKAADLFAGLKNYKDSSQRAITCRQAYKEKKFLRERTEKSSRLNAEKSNLQTELSNLKGLFTGRRRREIEARLAQIDSELQKLK